MNAEELRTEDESELRQKLTGLLHEQFNLRMQKGSGQMVTPHQLRQVRRNIARVKTVLNEKSKEGKAA
jgi:large subunit ribosomal protein L29